MAVASAWILTASDTPQQEPKQTPQAASQPAASPSATARIATGRVANNVAVDEPAVEPSSTLELPDGTRVDALNGAVDAPSMKDYWGPFDWSPIVGVETSSAGLEWYKHADGSYSTTQMVMRPDLGRMAAMTRVAHPGPSPASPAPKSK